MDKTIHRILKYKKKSWKNIKNKIDLAYMCIYI